MNNQHIKKESFSQWQYEKELKKQKKELKETRRMRKDKAYLRGMLE
jgi:hypothetical protein